MTALGSSGAAMRTVTTGASVRHLDIENIDELHAAALTLTRAFATDNFQLWAGRRRAPGPQPPPRTISYKDVTSKMLPEMRGTYYFFGAYIRTCALAGGRIMVVVEPMSVPRAETERDYTILAHKREAELHYQRVVTVGLWNPPGTKIDALHILIRSGMLKAITGGTVPWTGWGLRGYLRLAPLESKIIANHAAGCKIAGVAYEACWSLLALGTDPEAEGRGLGSLAIREGLAHIDALGAPCTLEATKARPKAIYERFGWKESGSVPCGAGEVDEAGLAPAEKHTSKAELTGFTLWTMLRLPLRIGDATTNVSSAHVPLDDLN